MHTFVAWAFAVFACRDPDPSHRTEPPTVPEPPTIPEPPTVPEPPTDTREPIDDDPLFDPNHLVQIDLTLDPADWDALRSQTRDLFDTLGGANCLAEPFESPFTEFEADVVVDGEGLARVGLSKKGLVGSLSTEKPSLKIDTDAFVAGQRLDNGTERIVLNNALQDPGYVNTCLGYRIFQDAGLPAPRCNFALVTVNGLDLGVYVHVEAVKKDFLARHFESADGDLYEGTLSDFVDGMTGTFEADTDATDPTKAPVLDLTLALTLPDDLLLAAVGAVLDLEAFYRFWAVESLVAHWDGYASGTNNFYLYRDRGTHRATLLPWGADGLFADATTPIVFTNGWLARRLWAIPESREDYLAALEDVLTSGFSEPLLLAEIDRMAALVAPHVADPATASVYQESVRTFISARRAAIDEGMSTSTSIVVDLAPPDGEDWCIIRVGSLSSTFETTWGTLLTDPFLGPPATIVSELVEPIALSGAVAGFDPVSGVSVLAVLGVTADVSDLYEVVVYSPTALQPGPIPVDLVATLADGDDDGASESPFGGGVRSRRREVGAHGGRGQRWLPHRRTRRLWRGWRWDSIARGPPKVGVHGRASVGVAQADQGSTRGTGIPTKSRVFRVTRVSRLWIAAAASRLSRSGRGSGTWRSAHRVHSSTVTSAIRPAKAASICAIQASRTAPCSGSRRCLSSDPRRSSNIVTAESQQSSRGTPAFQRRTASWARCPRRSSETTLVSSRNKATGPRDGAYPGRPGSRCRSLQRLDGRWLPQASGT